MWVPCEEKKKVVVRVPSHLSSRDIIVPSAFLSIVRVFLFSRDFVTFPRLLFCRLPSTRRHSLPLFSPLCPVSLPLFHSLLFLPVWFFCCAFGSGEGSWGRDLAIVGLFFGEGGYLEDGARCYGVSAKIQSIILF